MLLHESMMYTDANHNGLHTGTDVSEITKSGFVWFCKIAPHFMYMARINDVMEKDNMYSVYGNLTHTIAALPESISSEGMLIFNTSVSFTSQIQAYSFSGQ